jgi:hypothetical protein
VTNALRLVRGYVALLREEESQSKEGTEPDIPRETNSPREERRILTDRMLLRDHGVLRGGLRSLTMGVRAADNNGWTHVLIEDLLSTPDGMGFAPNCIVTLGTDIYPGFSGSSVGALACLCVAKGPSICPVCHDQ